jgi:hypothetical protein
MKEGEESESDRNTIMSAIAAPALSPPTKMEELSILNDIL